MLFPDINVWLALVFRFHFHHSRAVAWYEASGASCCFCRFTQQGFLRLATDPAALKDEAVSLQEAWGLYDAIMGDARVGFADEPEGIEAQWRAHRRQKVLTMSCRPDLMKQNSLSPAEK
jgi:predicted nucleic acid-binding protein